MLQNSKIRKIYFHISLCKLDLSYYFEIQKIDIIDSPYVCYPFFKLLKNLMKWF